MIRYKHFNLWVHSSEQADIAACPSPALDLKGDPELSFNRSEPADKLYENERFFAYSKASQRVISFTINLFS